MSKKKSKLGFLAGIGLGAGLGVLFAPKKGSETRAELKAKLIDFTKQIKEIDVEEVKEEFNKKVTEIKKELNDLDKEKALKIAKQKGKDLAKKSQELVDLAIEKGTPILRDAAEELKEKVLVVSKEVVKKLEKEDK
ncbi:MAG: YtxH domain-containing protein [Bacilli bacterium]|nr:YtxH domain-containing protein [Bacilli bacterium]